MKFCKFCDNMLYIDVDQEDQSLIYYCKHCENREVIPKENGSICVIDDQKHIEEVKYSQYITEYIQYDLTLPRINNIKCDTYQCPSSEVIYIKYDKNMKYMYHCCDCKKFWKKN